MLNFHKYGFLDCKRLLGVIKNESYWLSYYNPIWLFIWSDLYKPEIAFTNDFIYIRIYLKGSGIIYFPPLGKGDLHLALYNMKEDSKHLGIDFNMLSIDSNINNSLNELRVNTVECRNRFNYIFSADSLTLTNKKIYKHQMKAIKEFYSYNPDCIAKIIKKDDFPAILEFINNWNTSNKIDLLDINIYDRLNMIKKSIEHLYELDLVGLMIKAEDTIFGIAIASIINNTAYIHTFMSLEGAYGSKEALIGAVGRLLSCKVRYVNFESDNGNREVREYLLALKPLKLEECYQTFQEENED